MKVTITLPYGMMKSGGERKHDRNFEGSFSRDHGFVDLCSFDLRYGAKISFEPSDDATGSFGLRKPSRKDRASYEDYILSLNREAQAYVYPYAVTRMVAEFGAPEWNRVEIFLDGGPMEVCLTREVCKLIETFQQESGVYPLPGDHEQMLHPVTVSFTGRISFEEISQEKVVLRIKKIGEFHTPSIE